VTLSLHVEETRCTRCGACAALDSSIFDVSGPACRIARQPSPGERPLVEAARLLCPTDAIRASSREESDAQELATPDRDTHLYDELASGAERVRWQLDDLAWGDLDTSRVLPELRLVVREMAFSENATYSATQRFLDALGDDVEFSRWVSVWFYEETRHPHVLLDWLARVGERLPDDFTARGRVSTPFMRSVLGTLVTNVVSEVTASQAYAYLARTSPEPLLARIASLIAGDEARHAASFYRFGRRYLDRTDDAPSLRERARGLEVLHAWLGGAQTVTHPVKQMIDRLGAHTTGSAFDLDWDAMRLRVVRIVGALLGIPLGRVEDVEPALKTLLSRR
jgi:ferredoxin